MSTTTVAVAVLAVALLGTVVLLIANAGRRRRLSEDIPPSLRPAYSDEQLETSVLERYMSWGLILTLFFAIFLPAYWFREPTRIQQKQESDTAIAFARGADLYEANCAECHGTNAGGGSAPSPYGDEAWPAPNLTTMALRYEDSRTVDDVERHILQTVRAGRPGTPMPAWRADYGGPLTDHQIQQITDWILLNQVSSLDTATDDAADTASDDAADTSSDEATEAGPAEQGGGDDAAAEATPVAARSGEELYQQSCARCHGADLQGVVGPSLIGVFERHSEETILAILQNGINLTASGMFMPPWGEENWYLEDARHPDAALERIVAYLQARQPAELPDSAALYQAPGTGDLPEEDGDA